MLLSTVKYKNVMHEAFSSCFVLIRMRQVICKMKQINSNPVAIRSTSFDRGAFSIYSMHSTFERVSSVPIKNATFAAMLHIVASVYATIIALAEFILNCVGGEPSIGSCSSMVTSLGERKLFIELLLFNS